MSQLDASTTRPPASHHSESVQTGAPGSPLHLLLWRFAATEDRDLVWYAQSLADLLGAELSQAETGSLKGESIKALTDQARRVGADLVLYQPLPGGFLVGESNASATCRLVAKLPTSLLRVRGQRWPIRKILLLLHEGERVDTPAVAWATRLAQGCQAHVAVMPLVPHVPMMYGEFIQHDLAKILAEDSHLGGHLRRVARYLAGRNIDARLHLRQGTPSEQIRSETYEKDYDLVVIGSDPIKGVLRWLKEDLVNTLINWTGGTVLISKPRQAAV